MRPNTAIFGAHLWPKLGTSSGGDRYQSTLLATGYSCRSQVKLVDGVQLRHPVQAILGAVREPAKTGAKPRTIPREAKHAGLHQTLVDAEADQMG